MKTTTIDIQSAPKNATIHYMDYELGEAIDGQYSKNVRTGKCERTGIVPKDSLVSREADIKRFMNDPDVDRFTYRWSELDGIITIYASGRNNCSVNIEMHDDEGLGVVEDALEEALETVNDDNRSAEVATDTYFIRLYGEYSALLDLTSACTNFINFMSPIGIR